MKVTIQVPKEIEVTHILIDVPARNATRNQQQIGGAS